MHCSQVWIQDPSLVKLDYKRVWIQIRAKNPESKEYRFEINKRYKKMGENWFSFVWIVMLKLHIIISLHNIYYAPL